MAYDAARGRCVMHGGYDLLVAFSDTWEYGPAYPAAFTAFGSGCTGNAGAPVLAAELGSLPWLGDVFQARISNLGTNPFLNAPFLLLGDSKVHWGPFALPLDLGFVGMVGCSAFTNGALSYALHNDGGTALWSAQVPNVPSLAGTAWYAQAGVTAPGANPFGVALSNAAELRLGGR
jgi:hypothetical protein